MSLLALNEDKFSNEKKEKEANTRIEQDRLPAEFFSKIKLNPQISDSYRELIVKANSKSVVFDSDKKYLKNELKNNLETDNLIFYSHAEKAEDLLKIEQESILNEIKIPLPLDDFHGGDILSFSIPLSEFPIKTEMLENQMVRLSNGQTPGTLYHMASEQGLKDLKMYVNDINNSIKNLEHTLKEEINGLYDSRGCSKKEIFEIGLSAKPDLEVYEKKCLENELLTMQILNSIGKAYENYLIETKYREKVKEVKELETRLMNALEEKHIDAKELDEKIVEFRDKNNKLKEALKAEVREQMYLSLHEVTEQSLGDERLYKGPGFFKKFLQKRAEFANSMSYLNNSFDEFRKHNSLAKYSTAAFDLAEKANDGLDAIKEIKRIKEEALDEKFQEQVAAYITDNLLPQMKDKFLDKLKEVPAEDLNIDNAIKAIMTSEGKISPDKYLQDLVFKDGLETAQKFKEMALGFEPLNTTFVINSNLSEREAKLLTYNAVVEVLKKSNYIQELTLARNEKFTSASDRMMTSRLLTTKRKSDILVQTCFDGQAQKFIENINDVIERYEKNEGNSKYKLSISKEDIPIIGNDKSVVSSLKNTKDKRELTRNILKMDRYETILQMIELQEMIRRKELIFLDRTPVDNKSFNDTLSNTERDALKSIEKFIRFVDNEQSYILGLDSIKDVIEIGIPKIAGEMIVKTISELDPILLMKKITELKVLNYVSYEHEMLKGIIDTCV